MEARQWKPTLLLNICLFHARDMQTLLLDHNRLVSVPSAVCQLPQLEALVLSSNAITQLPGTISQLTALSQLKLNQNQLSQLPPAMGRCRSLREVDMSGNQLTVIFVCTIAIRFRVIPDVHNRSLQFMD
jgi:Leucine-rich repeat (LRR) protein